MNVTGINICAVESPAAAIPKPLSGRRPSRSMDTEADSPVCVLWSAQRGGLLFRMMRHCFVTSSTCSLTSGKLVPHVEAISNCQSIQLVGSYTVYVHADTRCLTIAFSYFPPGSRSGAIGMPHTHFCPCLYGRVRRPSTPICSNSANSRAGCRATPVYAISRARQVTYCSEKVQRSLRDAYLHISASALSTNLP
jgi:hypothetical protein